MNAQEKELAEAAAALTVEDFGYLTEQKVIAVADTQCSANTQVAAPNTQVNTDAGSSTKPSRKRRHVEHNWPEIGAVLESDYHGTRYQAEVIKASRYKSGKAIKILTGPATGRVCSSLTGAMLQATKKQRKEKGLGKKGVANGWDFWKVKTGGQSG